MYKFLEKSKCFTCKYLIRRRVILPNVLSVLEDFGIPVDAEGLNSIIENNDEIEVIHYLCKPLGIDIDHKVIECSEYIDKNKVTSLLSDENILDR